MPFAQFNEARVLSTDITFGSTYVPGTGIDFALDAAYARRFDLILATNTDAAPHTIAISNNDNFPQLTGSVVIPAGAGAGTIPVVDVLAALINDQSQRALIYPPSLGPKFDCLTAPAALTFVNLRVQGGSF